MTQIQEDVTNVCYKKQPGIDCWLPELVMVLAWKLVIGIELVIYGGEMAG